VIIPYRRFRTTYRSHLQGSSSPKGIQERITFKDGIDRLSQNVDKDFTTTCYVTAHKSAVPIWCKPFFLLLGNSHNFASKAQQYYHWPTSIYGGSEGKINRCNLQHFACSYCVLWPSISADLIFQERLTDASLHFDGHSITPSEFLALFFSFTVASYTLKTNSLHFYHTETALFRIIQFSDTSAFHRLVNYPFIAQNFSNFPFQAILLSPLSSVFYEKCTSYRHAAFTRLLFVTKLCR